MESWVIQKVKTEVDKQPEVTPQTKQLIYSLLDLVDILSTELDELKSRLPSDSRY